MTRAKSLLMVYAPKVLFSYRRPFQRMVFAVQFGEDGNGGLHWACGVIDFANSMISLYDSAPDKENYERFMTVRS